MSRVRGANLRAPRWSITASLRPARGMSSSNSMNFTLSALSSTLSARDDVAGDHDCQDSAIAYEINRFFLLRGAARYRWLLLARSQCTQIRCASGFPFTCLDRLTAETLPFRSTCHRSHSIDTSARIPSTHRFHFRARGKVESIKRHLHLNRASARYCSPALTLGGFKSTSSRTYPVKV